MITSQLLANIFPGTSAVKRDRFIKALNKYLPLYGINTHKRVSAFLATGGIETDYLRVTTEYASGADYEGRGDLGNTVEGDGRRFKGRGFFQTTGRYNYGRVNQLLGKKLGIDFLKNPERLAEIDVAVESACIFWKENNLAKYADAGQFKQFSAVVNCGNPNRTPNHWAKRNELYSKCVRNIPKDFSFSKPATIVDVSAPAAVQPIENSPEDLTNPVVLTPTKPDQDSFLASAVDRNISPDELKTAARTAAPRILVRFARPFAILYAMLEAGNLYAWLGVAVGVIGLGLLIYLHRNDLKKALDKVKNKFLQ
jgi:predicted chitinase